MPFDLNSGQTSGQLQVPQDPSVMQRLEALEKLVQELRAQLFQTMHLLSNEQLRMLKVIGLQPTYRDLPQINDGAIGGVVELTRKFKGACDAIFP